MTATKESAPRRGLSDQEKAQRKLTNALGYLNTLARTRAEAKERVGPWRDKEPSVEWWAELVAAERGNATEIREAYVASLPLAVRAPEVAELLNAIKRHALTQPLEPIERGDVIAELTTQWLDAHGYEMTSEPGRPVIKHYAF